MRAVGSPLPDRFPDDGAQLPVCGIQSAYGLIYGANLGTAGYALLTMAAANLLAEWGSEELKAAYLPQMLEGTYLEQCVYPNQTRVIFGEHQDEGN